MRVKGERILKNGAVAGYVYYSDEKKWKWRIIKGPKKRIKGGALNNSYEFKDLSYCFDSYDTPLIYDENKNTNHPYNYACIRDWKINDKLKGLGIGSYQLMYLIFNNELDKVYVNLSWNYNFWNKFLNFGGTKYNSYVRNTKCGVNVEYEYPTLRTLINSNEQDNINKLYILAEEIVKKYEKNKYIISKKYNRLSTDDGGAETAAAAAETAAAETAAAETAAAAATVERLQWIYDMMDNYIFDEKLANKQLIRKKNKNNYQRKKRICALKKCKIKSRGKGKFICNCNHLSTNV